MTIILSILNLRFITPLSGLIFPSAINFLIVSLPQSGISFSVRKSDPIRSLFQLTSCFCHIFLLWFPFRKISLVLRFDWLHMPPFAFLSACKDRVFLAVNCSCPLLAVSICLPQFCNCGSFFPGTAADLIVPIPVFL